VLAPRTIARGVELVSARTPTLPPATHTNSYAIGEREIVLVEPATPHEDEQREWLAWARALASQGRTLRAIALTHHHLDHVGGAALFARELGLPIWAHAATAARLPELPIARRLDEGEVLTLEGTVPQRWTVLHTPGHAPGHVCFLETSEGVVLVGDMVATVGTILIEPNDGDMRAYLAQLERLAALDARVALPAHGEPIDGVGAPSPTALFRFYIQHRLLREAKVHAALVQAGEPGADAEALVPVAYADTPPALWPIARMSLEAHLIKLEHDGRARRCGQGFVAVS
jgi:glyoxylase-like metal-dependent hydrolase (beta-lactamase superfamily II)